MIDQLVIDIVVGSVVFDRVAAGGGTGGRADIFYNIFHDGSPCIMFGTFISYIDRKKMSRYLIKRIGKNLNTISCGLIFLNIFDIMNTQI